MSAERPVTLAQSPVSGVKTFQLDECLNDARLANTCNSEGRCVIRRFPRRLKGHKDPVMLPDLLSKDAPLLTTDFTIVDDHTTHIPEINSGLIVIRSRNSQRPFTSRSASQNLARLKQKFPAWADTNWAGLYLEIDEEAVFLARLKHSAVPERRRINFDQQDFCNAFAAELNRLRASE
jgi:hypothetical protein